MIQEAYAIELANKSKAPDMTPKIGIGGGNVENSPSKAMPTGDLSPYSDSSNGEIDSPLNLSLFASMECASSSPAKPSEEESSQIHRLGFEASALQQMGFTTAKGIHDAGWQEFGYWFATPEVFRYYTLYDSDFLHF